MNLRNEDTNWINLNLKGVPPSLQPLLVYHQGRAMIVRQPRTCPVVMKVLLERRLECGCHCMDPNCLVWKYQNSWRSKTNDQQRNELLEEIIEEWDK